MKALFPNSTKLGLSSFYCISFSFLGLSNIPLLKCSRGGNGYAKLAISCENSHSADAAGLRSNSLKRKHFPAGCNNKKMSVPKQQPGQAPPKEVVVEVCEKATETTPSLLDFDLDDDFYFPDDRALWNHCQDDFSEDYEGRIIEKSIF